MTVRLHCLATFKLHNSFKQSHCPTVTSKDNPSHQASSQCLQTTDQRLRTYFENYGAVSEAFVSFDRTTGRPRGFGFVVFEDSSVADKVVSAQHTIDRREVRVLLQWGQNEDLRRSELGWLSNTSVSTVCKYGPLRAPM